MSAMTDGEAVAMRLHYEAIVRSQAWMDGVLTRIADNQWAEVVQWVGDCLNAVDAVDDDTIMLWDRAKAVVTARLDVEAAVERAVLALDMEAFERAGFDAAALGRACALAALGITA